MSNITVIGRGKIGKSHFINAILGKRLFLEDSSHCDDIIINADWGEKEEVIVRFNSGNNDRKTTLSNICVYASERENPANRLNVKEIIIRSPLHILNHHTITDLQCNDGSIKKYPHIFREAIRRCDYAILLFDVHSGFGQVEANFLEALRIHNKRLLFIAAHVRKDLTGIEWKKKKEENNNILNRFFRNNKPPLIYMNARLFRHLQIWELISAFIENIPGEISRSAFVLKPNRIVYFATMAGLLGAIAQADGYVFENEREEAWKRISNRCPDLGGLSKEEAQKILEKSLEEPQSAKLLAASWLIMAEEKDTMLLLEDLEAISASDNNIHPREERMLMAIRNILLKGLQYQQS